MKKIVFLIAVAVAIIAIVIPAGIALASQSDWYGTVGGVSVHAQKSVYLNQYQWYADLYSGATQAINIIGYSYWTVGEYCPATYTWAYWNQYPGDYRTYATSYYTAANINYRGCSGISRYWSLGNHDFAYGGQHIYPYVSTYEQR